MSTFIIRACRGYICIEMVNIHIYVLGHDESKTVKNNQVSFDLLRVYVYSCKDSVCYLVDLVIPCKTCALVSLGLGGKQNLFSDINVNILSPQQVKDIDVRNISLLIFRCPGFFCF